MKNRFRFSLLALVPTFLLPLSATANWLNLTAENLPSTLVVGHTYSDIVFKVKNTSHSPITVTMHGVQSPPGFSVAGYIGQCPTALPPGGACTVIGTGEYLTNSTHGGEARWSFHFTDGVESYTQDIVRKIATTGVIGRLTKPIPANVEKAMSYPIEYTFKSIGSTAKHIEVFKPRRTGLYLTNHCPDMLGPNAQCTVSGEYTPPASALKQTISFPVTLHYNDGESIAVTSHTTIDDIVINGAITKPLPPTVHPGVRVELRYTFTNVSNGDATGVRLQLPSVGSAGFLDSCPRGTMKAHTSCSVLIQYTPPASSVGKTMVFPVRFIYDEGAPIDLTARTNVVK